MSALPKIAPRATPLPPSLSGSPQGPKPGTSTGGGRMSSGGKPLSASIPTIYEIYPPRLPSAPDIPTRINPLCPPMPLKRTVMLETKAPHFQNDMRTARMKQREHYRYHNAWSKYYYGSPVEQESYKSYVRAVLKKQMDDSDQLSRMQFKDKVKESIEATERDNVTRLEDATDFFSKYQYLKTFRDDNKKSMEYVWADKRKRRTEEDAFDREQLRYNPINWSCTLK